ncbi:hypothetical protein GS511_01985 [Leptospira borgpetersenii]|nr:hypothetical protein GS524_01990 [Leptospira borgpetersenii]QHE29189.1 hypothetical protein GS523_01990 [Leptospira borgpetersenii]QHE32491.1 hypothetical protein GS517_01985 [Leptospira borgpetersenii]QHE35788.1 hypothetical protein GS510_01985 [Leptospira borgpetersenii]QHE39074.1 hypothetical protein GS527_02265 [Leptospira borgpetersenii]
MKVTHHGIVFIHPSNKSRSQNLKKNISRRSSKFLKNVRVSTETVALAVFSRRLKL